MPVAAWANLTCESSTAPSTNQLTNYSTAWGIDERNTRYQPKSTLDSTNIDKLSLKWVYGLANNTPRSYPLITDDTIYVGDGNRGLVALDRETGCERWVFPHEGEISTAVVPTEIAGQPALLFNDRTTGIYAIAADAGTLIWHAEVDENPLAWYSGTPLIQSNRVYAPISSFEVALAFNPFYGCCTTSGGLAAFDLETGNKVWYLPTIAEAPQKTGSHWGFVQKYGPSGATVWGAPSFNKETNTIHFGTGQNYSHPTTDTSDAIFAVNASDGTVRWHRQFTANDAYTAACNIVALNHPNCPDPMGPDADFGAATILATTPTGSGLLIAGQKSADVYALEPASGDVVWHQKLGRGGIIGGVHWGMAVNENKGLLFVPISDKEIVGFPSPGVAAPGLYALDIATGEQRWHHYTAPRCEDLECVYGLSAAPLATNDLVLTGTMDGYLNAIHVDTGRLLWQFDAWQSFDSVNNQPTVGGAFDAHGPIVAGDTLVVSAGYSYVGQQRGGNALLVFHLTDENAAQENVGDENE